MINARFNHYITHHDLVLHQLIETADIPAERLKQAIQYALFPGGKRLRPLLVYLSGEIIGVEQTCLDSIAAAIELTHCYSLIHDDLPAMDDDDFRRGKPSCHRAFDEATAILAGDGLQALAIDSLLRDLPKFLSPNQVIAVTQELLSASGPAGMVSGQSLDLSELANPLLKEEQLRAIHTLKTGKLISACIKMVLAAANPSESCTLALTSYIDHLGLVFQMQDDYLDAYAKNNCLGKNRSSDLANQKTTFASLYSQSELQQLINYYFQHAKEALVPLGEIADDLLTLTSYLQERGS